MQVFTCRAIAYSLRCRCGGVATRRCDYQLRGVKAGQQCNAELCESCAMVVGHGDYCGPHGRLVKAAHEQVG